MKQMSKTLDVYDVIGLIISANDNEIIGRTTIQKLVYLAKEKMPQIQVSPFFAYYYGPFNREVALALEKLVALDFLEEKRCSGYFNEGYSYALTQKGKKFAENQKAEAPHIYKKIKQIIQICKDLHALNSTSLSYAAKVHYMLHNKKAAKKKAMTSLEAVGIAKSFGWKISKSSVLSGAKLLEQLKLVEVS
jgi:uncharacterized protein YwgA